VLNCFEVHGSVSLNGMEEANMTNIANQIAQQTCTSASDISFS
jgi:hypothetical protein